MYGFSTIVSTVPRSANSIAHLPLFHVRANSHDVTDDFVAWDERATIHQCHSQQCISLYVQWSSVYLLLNKDLGMADTTSLDLDEDLAILWLLGLNLLDDNGPTLLFEHGRFVGLGNLGSHADGRFDCLD